MVIPHYLENKRRRRRRRIQSTDSFEVQKLKSEPAHKGERKDEKKSEDVMGGSAIESEERREKREKERKAGRRNVKTESETKRERKGSEVDQWCPDLISVEDVMMVSFLFICQVRQERRRKIGF